MMQTHLHAALTNGLPQTLIITDFFVIIGDAKIQRHSHSQKEIA